MDGLADYGEPIDLDEIMLYVVRETCTHENDTFLFHAAKLEFLRESEDRLEDYIDQLYEQHEACMHRERSCSSTTLRGLDTELARARADLEILSVEARLARETFENAIESSRDYEHQFAVAFEDLHREVELRIRLSP